MSGSKSTVRHKSRDSNSIASGQRRTNNRHVEVTTKNSNQNAKRQRPENGGAKPQINYITLSSSDEEEETENRQANNQPINYITLSDSEDERQQSMDLTAIIEAQHPSTETPPDVYNPLQQSSAPHCLHENSSVKPAPVVNSKVLRSVERPVRARKNQVNHNHNSKEQKKIQNSTTPENDVQIEGIDRGFKIPIGLCRIPYVFVGHEFDKKGIKKPKRYMRKRSRIGKKYQTAVEKEEQIKQNKLKMSEYKDRDEKMWKNVELIEDGSFIDIEKETEHKLFENNLHNVYWKAIWRQYEGHIPMEIALQHLMKNDYDVSKSLITIDETLRSLPQAFKPLCVDQARKFQILIQKKKVCNRELQEVAMRNYHISEVQQYFWKFRRFYIRQKKYGVECNCYESLCEDLIFEPRDGCANCTQSLRVTQMPDKEKLCLICKSYKQLTGKLPHSHSVIWNEDEKMMVAQWNQKEIALKRHVPREEFEKMLLEEKSEKWKKMELNPEEKSMIDLKEGSAGEVIAAKLQPFVLPHFSKCNCRKAGWISERSPNMMKNQFERHEMELYLTSLVDHGGDMGKVVEETGVELGILKRFVVKYRESSSLLKELFPDEMLAELKKPVEIPPASNMPPSLDVEKPKKRRRHC